MKAYLIITGTLFALLAVLHVWRMIVEPMRWGIEFWIVVGTTAVAVVLSIWAWKLIADLGRQT